MALQLGKAGGIDVDAQKLHPGNEGGLFYAPFFPDALDICAAYILVPVWVLSWFHALTTKYFFFRIIMPKKVEIILN